MVPTRTSKAKKYDFEVRARTFAKDVRDLTKELPWSISNIEYSKQLIRSSGSVGANFIEADDALSKKDSLMHMRISRKEAKESVHWLLMLDACKNKTHQIEIDRLVSEAEQLVRILSAIINKLS